MRTVILIDVHRRGVTTTMRASYIRKISHVYHIHSITHVLRSVRYRYNPYKHTQYALSTAKITGGDDTQQIHIALCAE